MKKILLSMFVALFAMTSCEKSVLSVDDAGVAGDVATLTVGIEALSSTRALSSDNGDATLTYYLEVYLDGKLYLENTSNKTGKFDLQLINKQQYTLVAWADYGMGYYDASDLQNVTMTTDAALLAINTTDRDAFAGTLPLTLKENDVVSMTLTRPFARVNVTTTDYTKISEGFEPALVALSYASVYTTYDVLGGGAVGEPLPFESAATIFAETSVDASNNLQLSADYLFVPTSGVIIDFDAEYTKADGTYVTDYSFTNIPVKVNYQTNISGAILTNSGTLSITVEQGWNTPDIVPGVIAATSPADATDQIADAVAAGATAIIAEISGTEGGEVELPATDIPMTFTFDNPQNAPVTFSGDDYEGEMDVALSADDLVVDLPKGSYTLSSGSVIKSGIVETAPSTFVVSAGASIESLQVLGGKVIISGSVGAISSSSTSISVMLDEGVATPTVSDSETNIVFVPMVKNASTQTFYWTLASAVTAATAGDVILVGAGEFNENVTINKPLTIQGPNTGVHGASADRAEEANFPTHTITIASDDVTLDGIAFQNGTNNYPISHSGAIANLTLKNLYVDNIPYTFLRNTDTTGDVVNLVVDGCKFSALYHSTFSYVFMLYNLISATFTDNVFDDITQQGLNLQLSPNATSLVIEGNTFTNIGIKAIQLANQNAGKVLINNNTISNCFYAFNIYAWKVYGTFAAQIDITNNTISSVCTVACVGNADYVDSAGVPLPFEEGAYVTLDGNKITLPTLYYSYSGSYYYVKILSDFYGYEGVVTINNTEFIDGYSGKYDSWENILETAYTFSTEGNPETQVSIDDVLYQPTSNGLYMEQVTE